MVLLVRVTDLQVRHDLPRPPSVITSRFGDTLFETYAGPGQGVQMIKASEWEPFIRTMPHSEFPSASACICQVGPPARNRRLKHHVLVLISTRMVEQKEHLAG